MSLIRQIAFHTGAQIGGKIVSTVLGLVAVMIITRSLGAEQFGWYITAAGFLQFTALLTDFGFNITTGNLLAEPDFDKDKLLNTLFSWRLLTALILNIAAPIIFLFSPYGAPIKQAVIILAISFLALSVNQVLIGYYQARLKAARIALAELISRLILVGGVALAAGLGWNFLTVMTIVALAAGGNCLALIIFGPKLRLCFDKIISRAIYKKIWPNAAAVMLNAFYLQGDRLILPLFVAPAIVGIYGASYRVLDIVIQISALIMGIMMPLATNAWSRGQTEEFRRHFQLSLNLVALTIVPIVAGVFALAEPILKFVAGTEFSGGGNLLKLLSLSLLGVCFGMVFGHLNLALNRQRQALWIFGSDAILSILGYIIFIPRFGAYGAAAVTIFSEFYAGIGLLILTGLHSHIWPNFKIFFKISGAALIMATTLIILPPFNLALQIITGAVIYLILILIFKIISLDTIKAILTGNASCH